MLKNCPNSIDVQDLQFKLQCRLKVFENTDLSTFPIDYSLVACASRYGLLFLGTNLKCFQAIQTKDLLHYTPKHKDVSDYSRRNVKLPSTPKHLCVNCDGTLLAVVVNKDECPVVLFYTVTSFYTKDVKLIKEIRLSATPNTFIKEINWNPSLPGIFTACKSDGSLGVYEFKGDAVNFNELPPLSGSTSFSWSPKGKQLIVGSINGKITQYKPDLKPVRVIKEPQLQGQHSVIRLQWVANYQFIGVYQSTESSLILVIDAPKVGEPVFTNYDDICYSNSSRPPQFYFIFEQQWNLLMVASANSTEVGVLGNTNETWTQWIMQDSARAELPLSSDHQETLPVGLGFDISSTVPIPWGEGSIPPCPLLLLLSHHGILCCFHVVNLKQDTPSLCTPPDNISDTSGLVYFIKQQEIHENKTHLAHSKDNENIKPLPALSPFLSSSGQATITPVKPQQSAQLFGGQATITPLKPQLSISVNKPLESAAVMPTPTNTTTEKYSAIFSALKTTAAGPPQPKPTAISTKPAIVQQEEVKPSSVAPTSLKGEDQLIDPKLKAENNAMLTQMIKEETTYLESELKAILHQSRSVKVTVGVDEEKTYMVQQLNSLQEFLKELNTICVGQSSEVHCLKQNLLQAWAWFEEARSHYNTAKNEAVALLMKSRPLDSLSQKRKNDIKQLIYYIESQLSQANKALDEQWNNFQDYAKKTHRVQMPTMEAIFQTMVRQNAVLQKQAYILKDISMRLRKKTPATSLALLCLDEKQGRGLDQSIKLQLNPDGAIQSHYDNLLKQLKYLSVTKTGKLRNLLKRRDVSHVTVVKPQLSSWTPNQPGKAKMIISLLGAQMSPVPKNSAVRNLDFTQSTPIRQTTVTQPISVANEIPLSKSSSIIGNKPGSAFVPATQMKSSSGTSTTPTNSATPTFAKTGTQATSASTVFSFGTSTTKQNITPSTGFTFSSTWAPKSLIVEDPFKNTAQPKSTTDAPTFSLYTTTTSSVSPITQTSSLFSNMLSTPKSTSSSLLNVSTTFSKATTLSGFNFIVPTLLQPPSEGFTPIANAPSSIFSKVAAKEVPEVSSTFVQASAALKETATTALKFPTGSLFGTPEVGKTADTTLPISTATDSNTSSANPISAFEGVKICSPASRTSETTTFASSIFTASKPVGSIFSTNSSNVNIPSANILSTLTTSPSTTFGPSTTSGSNLFKTPATTAPSIFAASSSTTVPSIFGTAPSSIYGGPFKFSLPSAPSAATTTTVTTTSSIFGAVAASSASLPSVTSGSTPIALGTPTTSSSGIETPTTSASLFGSAPSTPVTTSAIAAFGAAPSLSNISGVAPIGFGITTTATTPSSVSEVTTPSTSTTSSIFGAVPLVAPSSTPSSLFGTVVSVPPSSSTVPQSVFGVTTASAPTSNVGATTPSGIGGETATSNVFGMSLSDTATTASSIFGGSSQESNIFGGSATSTQSNSVLAPPQSTGSLFTQPIGGQSIFGSPQTSSGGFNASQSTPSIFGTTSTTSVFGSPQTSSTTTAFGSTEGNTSSIFGASQLTSTPSVFGATTAATNTTSIFGQAPAYSTASVFGTTTSSSFGSGTQTSTFGSGFGSFGSSAQPQNAFGFGNLSVGGASQSSGSIFGGGSSFAQAAALSNQNPFAKAGTASNAFTNPNASPNIFGTPAATTGSIFGSNTGGTFGSGFGTSNTFASSTFGQNTTFGQSSFGNTPFGATQSGPFSTPNASPVAQSGFGASPTFQKQSGFGSPPSFGGPPAPSFGTAPSFGGSPTFGTAATFGSPEKVFGAQTGNTFGSSASQPNTGFGNLANQNTIGFGNLAQQASNQSSLPFSSGSSSFSSWR
ncbi:nuclear pore complex protein Nup214 [Cylas formicarius]|uniref:nuclear pore complex protein Nup214 n=1 Tax=Cylas formicarius TaxID=197179 RepID=UPI0029588E48|nr:nuclear pore complex protein Nup214 [Cylas formicarius]